MPFLYRLDRTTARAGEHANCQGRHQSDRAKPWLHRGRDQKQTLAARQRVRGTSPLTLPVNDGCLPEPVKSASRPSGMAFGHT